MDEKRLLLYCAFLGVLGIIALFLLPSLPADTVSGQLSWSNGSNAWLASCEQLWVDFSVEPVVSAGECVELAGSIEGDSVVNARLLRVHRSAHRRCP